MCRYDKRENLDRLTVKNIIWTQESFRRKFQDSAVIICDRHAALEKLRASNKTTPTHELRTMWTQWAKVFGAGTARICSYSRLTKRVSPVIRTNCHTFSRCTCIDRTNAGVGFMSDTTRFPMQRPGFSMLVRCHAFVHG